MPSRRLTSPDPSIRADVQARSTARLPPLVSRLARTPQLVDLLPRLHQHAVESVGGCRSLLFQHNPRNGGLQATSGFGLDELRPDTWTPGPSENAIIADTFAVKQPVFVEHVAATMPDLFGRLGAPEVLLLPLLQGTQRVGLLAIGFERGSGPLRTWDTAQEIADGVLTTLELFRLRRNEELQREVRELFDQVSASLSTTLNLASGLDLFCRHATRLFGADRTSVWLHDRRSRHLTLLASSGSDQGTPGAQV